MQRARPSLLGDLGRDVRDHDDIPGGETARMLAVVRLGSGHELKILEHARAISSERDTRLTVIGTCQPPWWLCLSPMPGTNAAATVVLWQQATERLLRAFAACSGVEVRMLIGRHQVRPAVENELNRERYRYVVGRRADLPRRLVTRRRRDGAGMAVITVSVP